MKKRNTVLIFGVSSILILISVQIFIIRGVWQQKNELFGIRYAIRSQEALGSIWREMGTDGFDTLRYVLDHYSTNQAVEDLRNAENDTEIARCEKRNS